MTIVYTPVAGNAAMMTAPQFAPQGLLGGALGSLAGGLLGSAFGHGDVGRTIGGLAGTFLPFQAGPQMAAPQFAPQGWLSDLVSPTVQYPQPGTLGGLGQFFPPQLGSDHGGFGQQFNVSPFQAGPQMMAPQFAPQGWFGDLVGKVAQPIGSAIGGAFGQPQLGGTLGGLAGQLGQQYIPFQAGPRFPAYGYA